MPDISIHPDPDSLAQNAALVAGEALSRALSLHETVRLLAATGASQIEFLDRLVSQRDLDWSRIELFHLDEYIGIGQDHPASFARYMRERFIEPAGIGKFHLLDGAGDPQQTIAEISREIRRAPIHLAFAGIGENGHLAFNDPPANFETDVAYAAVKLDERCRRQQLGEGWFANLNAVPRTAISITVSQLLKSEEIICVVPDRRKAEAVRAALHGPVTPDVPASALQRHSATQIFLDNESASLL